jgi:hypothetical protein
MSDLNSLVSSGAGLQLTAAVGINNHGQIAVQAVDSRGIFHALLLTREGE